MSCRDRVPSITSVRAIVARVAATLGRVPAERIAENLAFINWTVLTALAVGAFAAVALARAKTDATRGFTGFTAACAVGFAVLALLSDGALPTSVAGSQVAADATWEAPRRLALAAFCVLAAGNVVAIARRRRAVPLSIAGVVAGVAVLAFAALGWG